MKLVSVCLLLSIGFSQLPTTDIWVFDLKNENGKISLSGGENVTDRKGYDNQPSFSTNGDVVYYVSHRGGQTDVYAYNIKSGKTSQITTTKESEYSPIQYNDVMMSVVRVDEDKKQRLYHFDLAEREADLVHKETEGVGYHTWINEQTVAIFHIKRPFHMRLVDIREGDWKTIALHIGRSMYTAVKSETIYYMQNEKDHINIAEITLKGEDSESKNLIKMRKGSTDFAVMADGTFVSGQGKKLYAYNPNRDKSWKKIHSLKKGKISRIAVSKAMTSIALVVE